jgi:hypothetical protein
MLCTALNERMLLGHLLAKLAALDPDVLVGHNIGAYELAVLLARLQSHKVRARRCASVHAHAQVGAAAFMAARKHQHHHHPRGDALFPLARLPAGPAVEPHRAAATVTLPKDDGRRSHLWRRRCTWADECAGGAPAVRHLPLW